MKLLTNLQLENRKITYDIAADNADYEQFIEDAIEDEPSLIARIESAENLLDLLRQHICEDQECPNEDTRHGLAEVLDQVNAHFETVAKMGGCSK